MKITNKTDTVDKNDPVRLYIKNLKRQYGTYRVFYEKLYGEPASCDQDIQTLINYISRGKLTPGFLRRVMTAFNLENVPMGEIFNYQPQTNKTGKSDSIKKGR